MPPQEMVNVTEYIYKRDIDLMMSVNQKAIELQTAVADQNEEIIEMLGKIAKQNEDGSKQKRDMETKIDKLVKDSEQLSRDIYKMQILFLTGVVSIIIQIVQIFLKK